jgi:hypothetical protein
MSWWLKRSVVSADSERMAASSGQRRKAAEILRGGGTQAEAAKAAGVESVSTIKRWLDQPAFQAMVRGTPDIRAGAPPRVVPPRKGGAFVQDERLRMWVASSTGKNGPGVLGSFIVPEAYDDPSAVVQVQVVQPDAVAAVTASIAAGEYPAESHYIPVSLAGLDQLLEDLSLFCRLGSADQRESLMAWLELWTFVDEDGRSSTLAESLWPGQQRFLEALLRAGHVLSVKSRKVGLSTLVCAHAAWTARIRDRNASVHLLSHRGDAAQELLRSLRRGLEGLPPFLRLPLERETLTVLTYAAGADDTRTLKAFPATPNSAIETTTSHLVLDEWAHTFDPEALWAAVEPTLAPRATSALITTARKVDDFVHNYYLRSEAGETRHTPVFVSALERPDRTREWLDEKRRQEGKLSSQRNYPLSAEEAFASASEPYFAQELIERAQQDALPPSPARRGDRYVKAWDVGRKKDPSVCVVLRAPSREEAPIWRVVEYMRLVGQDFPAIQAEIEKMHREYPGPTVIEVNSIGLAILENLRLPADELIPYTTSQVSKQAMLTEIEMLLQERTLKIHRDFGQLLIELRNYREADGSITQDSVMALGFAVSSRRLASASDTRGRINVELMRELNGGGSSPPPWWLDRQKIATDGLSYGLVRVVREVSDPREQSAYQADALAYGRNGYSTELEAMLAEGWTIDDPSALDRLGLRLDEDGKLQRIS